jgi:transcriptional regulator with XRE-family HTH domain
MNKKLGLKIREMRTKRGLTQYQLADMVVADVSTINKIEKNKANPSLLMLERISKALGVSVSELLDEEQTA